MIPRDQRVWHHPLIERGPRSDGNFCQTVFELGAEPQTPGRISFVVRVPARGRLVVKSDSVKRTVDEVVHFRLKVGKSRERESIDPACTRLVAGGNRTWSADR